MVIDKELFFEYCQNKLGHGNLNSKIWFISLEPAGGKNIEEVIARLKSWETTGKKEVGDIVINHQLIDKYSNSNFYEELFGNVPNYNLHGMAHSKCCLLFLVKIKIHQFEENFRKLN
jgi:hypothetical protein